MNESRHASLLPCLCVLLLATGCATADDLASSSNRHPDVSPYELSSNDTEAIVTEADAISMSAVHRDGSPADMSPPPRTPVTTSLVSATAPVVPSRRSLFTLASESSIDQAISEAPGTVILDFYADWCGPCRQQGKILHQMEADAARSGTTIIKINVDEHPELAQQLGISSLPTLMVVKDGRITQRQVGLASEERLASWIR